ncbi:putative 3-oxoacyl-[acyl-carrier-protein] reductase [Catonella morbi ATCC 51271]|uniref:Putative 3-oxoacyl-[acyl-carrier-protein] reductase n=1 Tax=Catonella morbi ATCC 51271 TaxID=592026 RepID=V2XNP8_9FIRM|nr:SDR family oxidoreductase [Catonella morbi]ESL03799.1 putative 3-oxoacyl-[acyl-carrier-protein] reductase [Catonella morbi ATCC 51271]
MGLLDGKVCLVTGASRGIGAATVKRFAREGAVVYANARTPKNLDDLCIELSEKYNTTVKALYFDVRDETAAKKAVLQIRKETGRLDVLVNNAGVMKDALIGMISKDLMQEMFDINVFGVMNLLQLASKIMMFQKSGSIINLSSIVGLEGIPGKLVYSAAKGAVAAMTKTAAKELASQGIRVNAVAPGMIDTDMLKSVGDEKMKEQIANIRMGRLGTPEEVADAILFLASDLSGYITGEILGVNGSAMV